MNNPGSSGHTGVASGLHSQTSMQMPNYRKKSAQTSGPHRLTSNNYAKSFYIILIEFVYDIIVYLNFSLEQ